MFIEWIVVLFPIVYLVGMGIRKSGDVGFLFVGGYVYPLFLLTALGSVIPIPGVTLEEDTINLARVVVHGLALVILLILFMTGRAQLRPVPAFAWAWLAILMILVSAIVNDVTLESLLRTLLLGVLVVNVFLLFPSLLRGQTQLENLARACVLVAYAVIAVSFFTITVHGFMPEWYQRLGRPWNSGLVASLIATALVASFLTSMNNFYRFGLILALFFAGSRLNLLLGVPVALYLMARERSVSASRIPMSRLGLAMICLGGAWFIYSQYFSRIPDVPRPFERAEALSGRDELWAQGWEKVQQSPWFGQGERFYTLHQDPSVGLQRVHNMPLELAASYGIFAALLAILVIASLCWFVVRFRKHKEHRLKGFYSAATGLVLLLTGHILFDTLNWTNLGDGNTLLQVALLAALNVHLSDRAEGRTAVPSGWHRLHSIPSSLAKSAR